MKSGLKLGFVGASLLLGLAAVGGDASARPASRVSVGIPAQAGAVCTADLRDGVVFEDHAQHPDASCKAKIAEHNKKTWMRRLGTAVGAAKAEAEAHVRMWEHALGVATIASIEKEYAAAKQAAAKAVGGAKAAAEQGVTQLEKRLHDAIDSHEKDIERHAAEAHAKLTEIASHARKEAEDLKRKFESAVGTAKHDAEAAWLHAEKLVHRAEEVLGSNELAAAKHKLEAVSRRVHAGVDALKARAQAEYDRVRAKVEGIHKRVRDEIAHVESRLKGLVGKAKSIVSTVKHLHDEVDHVEHALKNVFHGIFG